MELPTPTLGRPDKTPCIFLLSRAYRLVGEASDCFHGNGLYVAALLCERKQTGPRQMWRYPCRRLTTREEIDKVGEGIQCPILALRNASFHRVLGAEARRPVRGSRVEIFKPSSTIL